MRVILTEFIEFYFLEEWKKFLNFEVESWWCVLRFSIIRLLSARYRDVFVRRLTGNVRNLLIYPVNVSPRLESGSCEETDAEDVHYRHNLLLAFLVLTESGAEPKKFIVLVPPCRMRRFFALELYSCLFASIIPPAELKNDCVGACCTPMRYAELLLAAHRPAVCVARRFVSSVEFCGASFHFARTMNSEAGDASIGGHGDVASKQQPTAGILIIGDEVLKGQVADINTPYFCEKLTKMGIKVCKVTTIADDRKAITEEVKRFSKDYTYVLTSGGIGPTHDDVTFESVADAFGCKVNVHPELEELCKKWFKSDALSDAALKMALIPEGAKLNYGEDLETGRKSLFPLVSVQNVYMFPGVPPLMRKAMDLMAPRLFHHPEFCSPTAKLFLDIPEIDATPGLNRAVEKFPGVTFGSYPVVNHSYYKTLLTIEACDEDGVKAAEEYLRSIYPSDKVVLYDQYPFQDRWTKLHRLMERPDKEHLRTPLQKAINVVDECYQKYDPDSVCIFFNGGKDCTAALHLVSSYLSRFFPDARLLAVDVVEDDKAMFPQALEFIRETEMRYNFELVTYRGNIKSALAELLKERPNIKAGILGMRLGDPHAGDCDSTHFVPTDPDWPPLMRVYPILHFDYAALWDFIRSLCLPYCKLYDRGYTSLGRADSTYPNPALMEMSDDGKISYKPAYMLRDAGAERGGRFKAAVEPNELKAP